MQTISFKLPEDLLADLECEAKATRVTKSVLVWESLERALRHRSRRGAASCYDLARDLAGKVTGLPLTLRAIHNRRIREVREPVGLLDTPKVIDRQASGAELGYPPKRRSCLSNARSIRRSGTSQRSATSAYKAFASHGFTNASGMAAR
jgi:hypothetical protein